MDKIQQTKIDVVDKSFISMWFDIGRVFEFTYSTKNCVL